LGRSRGGRGLGVLTCLSACARSSISSTNPCILHGRRARAPSQSTTTIKHAFLYRLQVVVFVFRYMLRCVICMGVWDVQSLLSPAEKLVACDWFGSNRRFDPTSHCPDPSDDRGDHPLPLNSLGPVSSLSIPPHTSPSSLLLLFILLLIPSLFKDKGRPTEHRTNTTRLCFSP
jgi:hypothetical protein